MVRIRVRKREKKKERKRKIKKDETQIGERESRRQGKCEVNFDTFVRRTTV